MKKPVIILGALKITKIVWVVICLFFVWLCTVDFYTALKAPEIYPFGSEGPVAGLWAYESQKNHLISSVILIIWFFIGLMLCLFQHKRKKLKYGITVHIIATFIYIILQIIKSP